MSKKLLLQLIILTPAMLLIPSCSQVDITGRKQFILVPNSVMNSMSFQSYSEFLSENKLSTDPVQTQMVKRVGSRIQKALEDYCAAEGKQDNLAGYEWEFNLVEDKSVNAWCMPGGKVVVYTGILPVTQTEAGLAVVLGHEIAHAYARHGAERMTQGLAVDLGGMALSEALSTQPEQTKSLFLQAYGLGSQIGILLPYSRTHENEADHLGLIFMAMAGYDPHEAVVFWQRMAKSAEGKDKPPELLSTHPAEETRIRNIQALVPDAMKYYRPQGP
jgi:predicted Zn-dependent protease